MFYKLAPILLTISLFLTSLNSIGQSDTCQTLTIAEVHFKKTVFLGAAAKKMLDSVSKIIKAHSGCKTIIAGDGESCELCYQIAWDRIYSVRSYLIHKGIDSTKLIFRFMNEGDYRSVTLILTNENGPDMILAPHPCVSYHKLTKHRCTSNLDGHQKPWL